MYLAVSMREEIAGLTGTWLSATGLRLTRLLPNFTLEIGGLFAPLSYYPTFCSRLMAKMQG